MDVQKNPADDMLSASEMTPVAFGGCFGWLHVNRAAARRNAAVLICPGLNRDMLDAHHSLRVLADGFAAAGYPALRFDYPGIGDSEELASMLDHPAEHWAAWQQAVHAAAAWLRGATACETLVFCGLRIGAMLAAQVAASRIDVAGLILIAPVLRGRSYIRQLQIEAGLQQGAAVPAGAGLDFHELHFTPATVAMISAANLANMRLAAGTQVAIFPQIKSTVLGTCIETWRQTGALVHEGDFAGLEPLLHHNLQGENNAANGTALVGWLQRTFAAAGTSSKITFPVTALAPPGCIETPLRFGTGQHLFGMLCRPRAATPDLAVIMGNGGRDPHYGACRFNVQFARHLASHGIACLRMDFAGLGDSIGMPGKENVLSTLFEADRLADFQAALEVLAGLGYRRFAVAGLCSGAYHALHAAVREPRIETLLLVNLPLFVWQDGDTVDFAAQRTKPAGHYLKQFMHQDIWRKLRSGQVNIAGIFRAQTARMRARFQNATARAQETVLRRPSGNAARQALGALAARGARTLFLFAPAEVGISAMEDNFGPHGRGLKLFAGARMQIIDALDHTLTTQESRRIAAETMTEFLLEN